MVSYLARANFRLWPILLKNSLDKPLAYRRNAIFFGFSGALQLAKRHWRSAPTAIAKNQSAAAG